MEFFISGIESSLVNIPNFKKLKTITLTGKTAGKIDGLADLTIKVPSENTQRIHRLAKHPKSRPFIDEKPY